MQINDWDPELRYGLEEDIDISLLLFITIFILKPLFQLISVFMWILLDSLFYNLFVIFFGLTLLDHKIVVGHLLVLPTGKKKDWSLDQTLSDHIIVVD